MKVLCRYCNSEMDIPYWMQGASIECSSCSRVAIPAPKQHVPIPPSGYEITFSSFVELLTDSASRKQTLQLTGAWASKLEQLTAEGRRVASASPEEKMLLDIHRAIQTEPTESSKSGIRYELYQFGMSLWR